MADRPTSRSRTAVRQGAAAREEFLNRHLEPLAVRLGDLAPGTQRALHEYARFMLLLARAQSVTWNMPVVELCRAVESELAVAFRDCPGLKGLQNNTSLGEKATLLRSAPLAARGWLAARGVALATITRLANQVSALADTRRQSGAAHGGVTGQYARRADHDQALQLSLTGKHAILLALTHLRVSMTLRR